jgi:hypothetical protein
MAAVSPLRERPVAAAAMIDWSARLREDREAALVAARVRRAQEIDGGALLRANDRFTQRLEDIAAAARHHDHSEQAHPHERR